MMLSSHPSSLNRANMHAPPPVPRDKKNNLYIVQPLASVYIYGKKISSSSRGGVMMMMPNISDVRGQLGGQLGWGGDVLWVFSINV